MFDEVEKNALIYAFIIIFGCFTVAGLFLYSRIEYVGDSRFEKFKCSDTRLIK